MPTCPTCRYGCGCQLTAPNCGHYGCYGAGQPDTPCWGIAREEAAYEARQQAARAAAARTLAVRDQWAAAYRAVVALTLTPRPL